MDFRKGEQRDFVDSDEAYTSQHGVDILAILTFFAGGATYHLYRVTTEDGRRKRSDVIDAMGEASETCDIINMSIGHPDTNCQVPSSICKAAQRVIDSGTTLVAAAGNKNKKANRITCPAKIESVISVGASVAECRAPVDEKPPGTYWSEKNYDGEEYWEELFMDSLAEGPFCGHEDCSLTENCSDNLYEKPWCGNVGGVPDVLAPHHYPSIILDQNGDQLKVIRQGTSFAAPLVTGCLAGIFEKLYDQGIDPDPETVRNTVWTMGDEITEAEAVRFNARRVYESLIKA